MPTVRNVIVTDGGPMDLATAIICLAFDVPHDSSRADSLRSELGLGSLKAHVIETAFSYPNGVALVADEHGRTSLYLFDNAQETVTIGSELLDVDPATPVGDAKPAPYDLPAEASAEPVSVPVAGTASAGTAPGSLPDYRPSDALATAPGMAYVPDTSAGEPAPPPPNGALLPGDPAPSDEAPVLLGPAGNGLLVTGTGQPTAATDPLAGSGDLPAEASVAQPIPGVTSGYPVDAVTGAPVELSPAERDELAKNTILPDAQGQPMIGQATDVAIGANDLPDEAKGDEATVAAVAAAGTVAAPQDGPLSVSAEGAGQGSVVQAEAEQHPAAEPADLDAERKAEEEGYNAFVSGDSAASPYIAKADARYDAWVKGWDRAVADAKSTDGDAKPLDQSGFTSAEG